MLYYNATVATVEILLCHRDHYGGSAVILVTVVALQ